MKTTTSELVRTNEERERAQTAGRRSEHTRIRLGEKDEFQVHHLQQRAGTSWGNLWLKGDDLEQKKQEKTPDPTDVCEQLV